MSSKDYKKHLEQLKKGIFLPPLVSVEICSKLQREFLKVDNIINLKCPITLVGDIHGQLNDLLELFDVGGYFNTSTFRYTPLVAGYYSVHMSVLLESANYVIGTINKNGVQQFNNRAWSESGLFSTAQISGVIHMNGSTDYLEGTVYHNVGSTQNIRGADAGLGHSYFCGFFIG